MIVPTSVEEESTYTGKCANEWRELKKMGVAKFNKQTNSYRLLNLSDPEMITIYKDGNDKLASKVAALLLAMLDQKEEKDKIALTLKDFCCAPYSFPISNAFRKFEESLLRRVTMRSANIYFGEGTEYYNGAYVVVKSNNEFAQKMRDQAKTLKIATDTDQITVVAMVKVVTEKVNINTKAFNYCRDRTINFNYWDEVRSLISNFDQFFAIHMSVSETHLDNNM